MTQGNKYTPLMDYLQRVPQDEITLTFNEIETLIGDALPPSARTRRGWWGNRLSLIHISEPTRPY